MERKINNGFVTPLIFSKMIIQGNEGFKSFFELGVNQTFKHFNKKIKKYNVGNNFTFVISETSNNNLELNVEIISQNISNTDVNLLIEYLKQYKHENNLNFKKIVINFNTPIINQQIFDLIQDKTQEVINLNNQNIKLTFSECDLRNVDLTKYTIQQLDEMKILSEVARFDNCKINIETLETILNQRFYKRDVGDLCNLDISKISIEDMNNLDKNFFKDTDQIKLNLEGVKLSREQFLKILTIDGFLGRKKGDLSGFNLSDLDLSNLNLSNLNFKNTILINTNLKYTNLAGANLRNANLRNANLICADLRGVDLSNTNLKGIDVRSSIISREQVEKVLTNSGYLDREIGDLHDFNLNGLDLNGLNFTNANLSKTYLLYANLTNANLTNANLEKAELPGANLTGANLTNANLINTFLAETNLTNADLTNVNLIDVCLSGANLENANLVDTDLIDIDLRGANLKNTILERVNLKNVDLKYADLINTTISEEQFFEMIKYKIENNKKNLIKVNDIFKKIKNIIKEKIKTDEQTKIINDNKILIQNNESIIARLLKAQEELNEEIILDICL